MNKKSLVYVTIALVAGACVVAQQWISRANEPSIFATTEAVITEASSPAITPTYEGCYYVWAYRDLPELSAQVHAAIQRLQPEAQGRAQAFGEDCVYADGRNEFGAMETDFYLILQVQDLNDEELMGNWIAQAMRLIEQLPDEQVPGGAPGLVEFRFSKSQSEFLTIRVPIERYRNEAQGKTGAELFHLFYENP